MKFKSVISGDEKNMLEIKNLTKKYGNFTALDNINITLENGVYGILGANGAGKSTFLNLITDNIKRTSGEILYNNTDILGLGAGFRKKVGYTPQLQGMYEEFTAGQFMRYVGALKGMKRKKCRTQTKELLTLVGLDKYSHNKLGSFSGGMRQRVLLATHVVDDIECIAQKVILMKKGKLLRFESPAVLMDEIIGKVGEYHGSFNDVCSLKEKYGKGQTIRRRNDYVFRAAEDDLPAEFIPVNDITLEDVYLYYAEGRK